MSALHKAAERIKPALERWEITIPKYKNEIFWRNERIIVAQTASRKECEAILRRVIRKANKQHFEETQEKLL